MPAWALLLVGGFGVWLAGSAVRDHQLRGDMLEERALRLEHERELSTRVALADERQRIARELHDVVAHSVSVMVVQTGAARTLLTRAPEQATEALLAVERSGREALGELRNLLGLLTDADAEPALAPQPGLGQLDRLVERVGQAGLPIDLQIGGTPRELPPGLDLTAYRIRARGADQRAQVRRRRADPGQGGIWRARTEAGSARRRGGNPERWPNGPAGGRARDSWACNSSASRYMEASWKPGSARRVASRCARGCRCSPYEPAAVLRVVIADDQALVRAGFRMILEADGGVQVVGEAADGEEAVATVRRLQPDVVLMDVRMPLLDGLEATRRIMADDGASPASRVIMLTTFDVDEYVYTALRVGASGFLLKDVSPEQLVAAVRLVATGDALLAPSITRRLVERFARRGPWPQGSARGSPESSSGAPELSTLTSREREVLVLMARGLSNAELADRLTLSEATVKTHVARILSKLELRDRVQAVVLAYETGVVTPGIRTTRRGRPTRARRRCRCPAVPIADPGSGAASHPAWSCFRSTRCPPACTPRGVVVAEEAIALQPARRHQDEDPEGRVAEAKPGGLRLREHADHQVQAIDAAFVDVFHLADPLRVVRDFFEGLDGPQMQQVAEERVAGHAELAHAQHVGRRDIGDLAVGTGEVLQEARIVVQLERTWIEGAERVDQILDRRSLEQLVAVPIGDLIERALLDQPYRPARGESCSRRGSTDACGRRTTNSSVSA